MSIGPEFHAFSLQERSLSGPSRDKAAASVHNPVAGQAEFSRRAVQHMTYKAGVLRATCQERYLAVSNHLSPWDGGYHMVNFLPEFFG